jgi:uncharacterized protein
MTTRFLFLSIFLAFLFTTAFGQEGIPPAPNPPRLVNDLTGTLTQAEQNTLETKLLRYEDTTSTQVAILLVNSTAPYDVGDFAQRTAQAWGVGSDKDNGVFVVVAVADRKIHIATGYGMEGAIPDAAAFTIIKNFIQPNFRAGNYYAGLDQATTAIFGLASGEFTAEQLTGRGGKKTVNWGFIIMFILFFVVFPFMSRRRRGYQDYGSRGIPWWILMGGGMGHRGSGWNDFNRGGGSFGGGGGFGGGGFGGFGGGGFGGGGASGGW